MGARLKGQFLTKFPANVSGSGPITVTKTGLNYTFGLNWAGMQVNPTPANTDLLMSVTASGAFQSVTIAQALASGPVPWANLTGKPSTFAPSAHTHAESDVTGLVADLAAKADAAATTTALAAKAPLASPALTGTPTAPTAANGTNTTQIATTAFVLANGPSSSIPTGGTTGQVLAKNSNTNYDTVWATPAAGGGGGLGLSNGAVAISASSGALTVAIKTLAGADPSSGDPVTIIFPTTTGSYVTRTLTAALSLVIPSGATFGLTSNVAARIWFAVVDNAGAVALVARNCLDAGGLAGFPGNGLLSTMAVSTAADNGRTTYAAAALTDVPFVVLGFSEWTSGLVSAGTWTAPTRTIQYVRGMPLPGGAIQSVSSSVDGVSTPFSTASASYVDTGLTATITPTSACNPVVFYFSADAYPDTAGAVAQVKMRRGGTEIGLQKATYGGASPLMGCSTLQWLDTPGATSAQTYTLGLRRQTGTGLVYSPPPVGSSTMSLTEMQG